MHIALGVSATSDTVTAALVDVELPQLGPVDERVTSVSAAVGDVGAAVATAIGVMRLRAARADLAVADPAVVLSNPELRNSVSRALRDQQIFGAVLLDADDVDPAFDPAVAAAIWAHTAAAEAETGPIAAVATDVAPDAKPTSSDARRGFAVVGAGIAAAVVAGSFAIWAVTAQSPEPSGIATPLSNGTSDGSTSNSTIAPNPTAPDPTAPDPAPGPAGIPPLVRDGGTAGSRTVVPAGGTVGASSPESRAATPAAESTGSQPSTRTQSSPSRQVAPNTRPGRQSTQPQQPVEPQQTEETQPSEQPQEPVLTETTASDAGNETPSE
ncbi:MAG: hypothetical protein WA931_18545 [Rhodococcus sp. (in: high G+C Gram-positive bacteria)]